MTQIQTTTRDVRQLTEQASALMRANDWPALAALAADLPVELDQHWVELVDNLAFAFSQLHRNQKALTPVNDYDNWVARFN